MKIYVYFVVNFVLFITGCSNKAVLENGSLSKVLEKTVSETTTEMSVETTVFEQYLLGNDEEENRCSDIMAILPPIMEGKWLITEGVHLCAVERIEESYEGTVIEFSKEAIKVNDEVLINPKIIRDVEVSYRSFIDAKLWVDKIGMGDGDFARCITVEGWLDSEDREEYIQILYFDGKPHLMSGCDYGMEKFQ